MVVTCEIKLMINRPLVWGQIVPYIEIAARIGPVAIPNVPPDGSRAWCDVLFPQYGRSDGPCHSPSGRARPLSKVKKCFRQLTLGYSSSSSLMRAISFM